MPREQTRLERRRQGRAGQTFRRPCEHCPVRDQRHLVLLAWMVAGLLLSETVCFDRWKKRLPLAHCLAASWKRRCRRWLANSRIDVEALYGPLVLCPHQRVAGLCGQPGRRMPPLDPHWKRGLSFVCIGLHWLQQSVIAPVRTLLAWMLIPLQALEPCIPSRAVR